jgi:hypothetical protein
MELLCDVGGVIIPGDKVGRIGGIESVEEVVSLRLGAGLSQKKEVSLVFFSFFFFFCSVDAWCFAVLLYEHQKWRTI